MSRNKKIHEIFPLLFARGFSSCMVMIYIPVFSPEICAFLFSFFPAIDTAMMSNLGKKEELLTCAMYKKETVTGAPVCLPRLMHTSGLYRRVCRPHESVSRPRSNSNPISPPPSLLSPTNI